MIKGKENSTVVKKSSKSKRVRKFSIKKRVTFWYVAMFVVILLLAFFLLISYGQKMMETNARGDLETIVDQSVSDVRLYDGDLTIDDGLEDYVDGVNILVLRNNGLIVTGLYPQDFLEDVPFKADEVRRVEPPEDSPDDTPFFVYDRKLQYSDDPPVWIRGVSSAAKDDIFPATSNVSMMFFMALPFLVLVAVMVGYYITKRAFAPINHIIATAENIQAGKDLSKRIEIEGLEKFGKDEIYMTAKTFNDMLDRLEASFEMERQFSRDASHELRTPIAVIMNQSQLALENLDDREEVEEAFRTILAQSERMSGLTNELLALARADRNMLQLNCEAMDLSKTVDTLAATMDITAAKNNVKVTSNCQESVIINGDAALIERMLENIISNGIKYNKPGGTVELRLFEENGIPTLVIEDTGIGIPDHALPKIWDRFFRVDDVRNADQSGSMGLGLSMVRQISNAHHIDIDVESRLGEGTSFILRFCKDRE